MSRTTAYGLASLPALVIGALIAAILVLLPLPTVNTFGAPSGFCGPGARSDNAVQVLLNPNEVNQDSTGSTDLTDTDAGQQWRDYCVGRARSRVEEAGLAAGSGMVLCGLLVLLVRVSNVGRPRMPWQ